MRVKAHRKPLNLRKITQLTEQLLNKVGIMTQFILPPITPEEDAEVNFRIHQFIQTFTPGMNVVKELGQKAAEEKYSRLRHFTIVKLFVQLVMGTLKYHAHLEAAKHAPKVQPAVEPEVQPLGPTDAAAEMPPQEVETK